VNRLLLAGVACVLMAISVACTTVVFEETGNRLRKTPEQILELGGEVSGTIVWGGQILSVSHGHDWIDLEVLAYPLDAVNSPAIDKAPVGRFIASYPRILKSPGFAPGQVVTLAGDLQGLRQGQVDETEFQFPAVLSTQVHVWSPPK
jgi:outer membrane lipoprotein